MFPSHLPVVMNMQGEAEVARAAEKARHRAALTATPRRNLRSLRVPRIRAKGFTRRPAAKTAARSA